MNNNLSRLMSFLLVSGLISAQGFVYAKDLSVTIGPDTLKVSIDVDNENGVKVFDGVPYQENYRSSAIGRSYVNRHLEGMDFSNVNLTGSNFSNADLLGINFRGANLTGVNFSNAKFSYCDFRGANVEGVNFSNVNFGNSKISGVNFSSANMSNVHMNNVSY